MADEGSTIGSLLALILAVGLLVTTWNVVFSLVVAVASGFVLDVLIERRTK